MFTKFLNLEQEKQNRIINAAMKEFAQNGYEKSSTNEIVKEAGISKGLLFHYFQNKKQLYLFLFDHMVQTLMEQILKKIDWDQKDILVRYRQIALLKMELYQSYPEMFNFVKTTYTESSKEIISELNLRGKELLDSSIGKLFSDIDHSKFKKGLDPTKALNIINWTIEGFAFHQQDKAIAQSFDFIENDNVLKELDIYLEILKNALYE